MSKINVTLSASLKSLKEQAKLFIDTVEGDLRLIDTQEYKTEILVEYKKSLDVSDAITTVVDRHKEIEVEKAKVVEKIEEVIEKVETIVAPIVEEAGIYIKIFSYCHKKRN